LQADHDNPHLTNGRAEWEPVGEEDIRCWLGIVILMGLKVEPHRRLYWSLDHFYGYETIQACMTRQRFEAITRCIHLVDNDSLMQDRNHPGYDRIGKVL
jgi:hypothetical protein